MYINLKYNSSKITEIYLMMFVFMNNRDYLETNVYFLIDISICLHFKYYMYTYTHKVFIRKR